MCHHALLREDRIVTNAECHHTTKLDAMYQEPFLVATKMDFDNYRLLTILHSSVPSVHISDLLSTQPPKRTCNVQHGLPMTTTPCITSPTEAPPTGNANIR